MSSSVKGKLIYENLFAVSCLMMERVSKDSISFFVWNTAAIISMLSHRMKTNTEMVCLRNFKRCRPPDWRTVNLLDSFFSSSKYKYLKYIILVNVDLCSLLNKYSLFVKYPYHGWGHCVYILLQFQLYVLNEFNSQDLWEDKYSHKLWVGRALRDDLAHSLYPLKDDATVIFFLTRYVIRSKYFLLFVLLCATL